MTTRDAASVKRPCPRTPSPIAKPQLGRAEARLEGSLHLEISPDGRVHVCGTTAKQSSCQRHARDTSSDEPLRNLRPSSVAASMNRATSSVESIASNTSASESRSSRSVTVDPVMTGGACRQSLVVTD